MEDKEKMKINFIAINPYIEKNIVSSTETDIKNQGFVEWGEGNLYPSYCNDLYMNVPTLHSIINGIVDYVTGDDVKSNNVFLSDTKMRKLVANIAIEYALYGGFALNVLRNKFGAVVNVEVVDMRKLRTNQKQDTFYYSDDFNNKSYGRCKYIVLPLFDKDDKAQASSIYYFNNSHFKTYPTPHYASAVIACEIEKSIDEFHLSSIENGMMSGYMVNFNNGTPSEEMQDEIERNFNEKFCGKSNAGRVMLSFNESAENAVTVEKLDIDDYGEKYESLAKRAKQEIFTAFRANPNLFGINTENNGFAQEDFENSFKLFNKTVITPMQNTIVDAINDVMGENSVEIQPFTIKFETENNAINETIE